MTESERTTAIPDASAAPIGTPTPATTAILARVHGCKGAPVPVAAFQSSI